MNIWVEFWYSAFYECRGLTSIEIPSSVTSIGNGAFKGCAQLRSINVEENNQSYCSEDGILFNKDKTELIQYPQRKGGTQYIIPSSVTSIGSNAFYWCDSLTSIEVPNGVMSIENGAFYCCRGLTSIKIPKGVTSIGNSTFFYCTGLANIEITSNITRVEQYAFYGCGKLTEINYHGTEEQFKAITIGSYNDYFKNATVNYIE